MRADGSPRISGIECELTDGDLRFGSMTGARKGADLKRDPRFALHGPTFHPEEAKENNWPGEAKMAGRAVPAGAVTTDEAGEQPDGGTFIADITEVVITALDAEATRLVVEAWTPNEGSEGPSGTSTRSRRSVRRRARSHPRRQDRGGPHRRSLGSSGPGTATMRHANGPRHDICRPPRKPYELSI